MRNIRLTIAYDGTEYHGFQRQPLFHGPTVQGTLEAVWKELTGEDVVIATAGRTDTGVHALGQVVSFYSQTPIPAEKIPKAFNSLLPHSIRISKAEFMAERFHARISAHWKRYDYMIDNAPIHDVFSRLYTFHEPVLLDVERMKAAAQYLEGRHNFKTFAAAGSSSKTFERTLYRCRVTAEGQYVRITCVGDGFLYNMVRIIAGTLLHVGKGRIRPDEMPDIIASQDRSRAKYIAPAHGLTLTYVHYGEESPQEVFPELFL